MTKQILQVIDKAQLRYNFNQYCTFTPTWYIMQLEKAQPPSAKYNNLTLVLIFIYSQHIYHCKENREEPTRFECGWENGRE